MAKAEYRSAIRSRKLINKALVDLLQEKPLDKITVSDVVRRAEINRGTFYAHYSDIPDVIHHWVEKTFSSIRDSISAKPRQLESIPHMMLLEIQHILEKDLEFYRNIMASSSSKWMQEQLVNTILDYMYQNEKDFGFGNHDQFVLTTRFCAGGLSNLYQEWLAGKLPFTLDELTARAEGLLSNIISWVDTAKA